MRVRVGVVAALVGLALSGVVAPADAVDDPGRVDQYGLELVRAPSAWSTSTGKGVTIAVVDTGVDLDHPDLAGKLVPGIDLVEPNTPPEDTDGHGTHVAGIAAAVTGNGTGVAGVAPEARIMPVRVLDTLGTGDAGTVIAGIRWAVDHGAGVINLSLGALVPLVGTDQAYEDAIAQAWSRGVVVVASSGNLELVGAGSPSGYSRGVKAVVVTATDKNRKHPEWANRADTAWSLAAPGEAILSTLPDAKYGFKSGTSMAAPHVAGVAALALAKGLTPQQVVDRLLATARRLGDPSSDGAGLVDAAAVVAGGPAPAPAPAPRVSAPAPAAGSGGATRAPSTPPATGPAPPTEVASPPVVDPVAPPAPVIGIDADPGQRPFGDERDRRRARQVGLGLAALLLAGSVTGFVLSTRRLR